MGMSTRLDEYLKSHRINYQVITHKRTNTAVETAEADAVPPALFAKVVMIKADGKHVMVVVPASCNLDLLKLEDALNTKDIKVEHENDFAKLFPDCEPGAMPPLGVLYDLPCYMDLRMARWDEIYFNAGDHEESIALDMEDYLRVAKVTVVDVAAA